MSTATPVPGQSQHQTVQTKTTSSKPPVTLPSTSHLDPGAYVRGSHPITIGQHVLIHPRAHLLSTHGPLTIEDGCIISEKCVIGGPLPPTPQTDAKTQDSPEVTEEPPPTTDETPDPKQTLIQSFTHLHANVTIDSGATIKPYAVIESNTTIKSGAIIGTHSKICANMVIRTNTTVPEWTIIYGSDNDQRHRNRKIQHASAGNEVNFELVERQRLKAMGAERDGTISILRLNAAKSMGGGSRTRK